VSSEAIGWVFRNSPYEGVMFALHLAIADTVNDAHGNELWASAPNLATKARISERSARDGLAQLRSDGYLVLLESAEGKPRRYRFEFLDPGSHCTPAATAPLQLATTTPEATAPQPLQPLPGTPAATAPNPKTTQRNPKQPAGAERFDEFWNAYPRREAKGGARKAWLKALAKTDPDRIIAAAVRYRDSPLRDQTNIRYTAHPATWLNQERWDDETPDDNRDVYTGVVNR
jgi:hypothetical protein